jgi:hypothetical protein
MVYVKPNSAANGSAPAAAAPDTRERTAVFQRELIGVIRTRPAYERNSRDML